jgi:stress response protein SCP2
LQLPIVKLVGRKFYKVFYKNEKWAFEKGKIYKDLHPSFSVHLSKLKDDRGKYLFQVDNCAKQVSIHVEHSYDAVSKNELARMKVVRRARDHKNKILLAKAKRSNTKTKVK